MRTVPERKPVYIKDGNPIYNPGFVDCFQKPWYVSSCNKIEYYGRFAKQGYPGEVNLEFGPLRDLINKIDNLGTSLKNEIMVMIEELEDAHYAERDSYISCLPSAD